MQRNERLSVEQVQFILSLLEDLPDGDAVLHGDFHPDNVLIQEGRYYVIDWPRACRGSFVADIAHTYLLFADKPRIIGESDLEYRLTKAAAKRLGRMYLLAMRQNLLFSMEEFGKWLAVQAASRSVFGQQSELESKADFVKNCKIQYDQKQSACLWHTLL